MKPPECKYQAAEILLQSFEKEEKCPFVDNYCGDCPLYVDDIRCCSEIAKGLIIAKKFELL